MNEYDKVQKRLEAVKQDLARTLVQLETMGALEDIDKPLSYQERERLKRVNDQGKIEGPHGGDFDADQKHGNWVETKEVYIETYRRRRPNGTYATRGEYVTKTYYYPRLPQMVKDQLEYIKTNKVRERIRAENKDNMLMTMLGGATVMALYAFIN